MYKLGIDVGGTNTDAVLINDKLEVVAELKSPTTDDIYSGILDVTRNILKKNGINPSDVRQAMLGTTQCTNAIVERKKLAPIGVLRIGAPASEGIPPMIDWAEDLKKIVVKTAVIGGGFEYDGRPIGPFDRDAATHFFGTIKGKVQAVAITSVFATVRNDHELEAADLCREILGDDIPVSISSEIGSISLIERENATILNATLYEVAESLTNGFQNSLAEEGIVNADIYLSQNDGTLMGLEYAKKYPILTIACGPTNSIRGAGYLSRMKDAIVIDVGGTTTDLGFIKNGFPRESSIAVTIGGVRTNFRMPDVISIGIGGGSVVREINGLITVGPDSVGHDITTKSMVFGGDIMTATDIAVRSNLVEGIGDKSLVQTISQEFAERALNAITEKVEETIDMMKLSSEDIDVILVGGGSIILPELLKGAKNTIKPQHFSIANAIGSAISKVSGNYEKLMNYEEVPRDEALAAAKAEAIKLAADAGAIEETIEIVDLEDVPLQYHPGNTCRIKVKAAGDLK